MSRSVRGAGGGTAENLPEAAAVGSLSSAKCPALWGNEDSRVRLGCGSAAILPTSTRANTSADEMLRLTPLGTASSDLTMTVSLAMLLWPKPIYVEDQQAVRN